MAGHYGTMIFVPLVGLLLAGLVAAGVRGRAALRELRRANAHAGDRIQDLSRRLQLVEARLAATTSTVVSGAAARRAGPTVSGPRLVARVAPAGAQDGSGSGIGPTLIEVPDLGISAAGPPQAPPDPAEGLSLRHADIREMAQSGATPDLIARRTNRPVGQVELILALQRRLREPGEAGPHARPE
ncbi:hypothetical protein OJF2_24170 [Aquisphaera giovannonii]|uniref:Uncharacterized protein n=1 Tax=Aquisphaera giovannonii TaxID=406548 RepID=A0A5B9W1K5_9BACT|nr:hypothetical protein [Aquisphaera giovannonii]QEH33885.1 hypothetical protein OJF2_24170 [Aquisphaera giovannonii]